MKKQLVGLIASITVFLVAGLVYTGSVHKTGPPGLLAAGGGHHDGAGLSGATVVKLADYETGNSNNAAPGALEVNPDLLMPSNSLAYGGGQASKDADIAQQHNQVVPTVTEKVAGDMGGTTPRIMPTAVAI